MSNFDRRLNAVTNFLGTFSIGIAWIGFGIFVVAGALTLLLVGALAG